MGASSSFALLLVVPLIKVPARAHPVLGDALQANSGMQMAAIHLHCLPRFRTQFEWLVFVLAERQAAHAPRLFCGAYRVSLQAFVFARAVKGTAVEVAVLCGEAADKAERDGRSPGGGDVVSFGGKRAWVGAMVLVLS